MLPDGNLVKKDPVCLKRANNFDTSVLQGEGLDYYRCFIEVKLAGDSRWAMLPNGNTGVTMLPVFHLFQFLPECLAGDMQQTGSLALVPAGFGQGIQNHLPAVILHGV